LGANGAGKTTTLRAISGLLAAVDGQITDGEVWFGDERIDRKLAHEIAQLGVVQVMEGRRIFKYLTVEENLEIGYMGGDGEKRARERLERVYQIFPRLKELRKRTSGYLSGGEQQMLVIGRALMSSPKLILLDEPSLGLSPVLVQEIFRVIRRINEEQGTSFLLVEQNAILALDLASYCYVMENGRIVLDGPADKVRKNEDIREFYLGLTEIGFRKSYREVKHYKRRKRWLG
jgi:branched-chain amino acid transport system ATP-binding protein